MKLITIVLLTVAASVEALGQGGCPKPCLAGPSTSEIGTQPVDIMVVLTSGQPFDGSADPACKTCTDKECRMEATTSAVQLASPQVHEVQACLLTGCSPWMSGYTTRSWNLESDCNDPTPDFAEVIIRPVGGGDPVYRKQIKLLCVCIV